MSDLEQRIRERAYQIWLQEGMPEGRHNDHRDMAAELIAIEDMQKSTLKTVAERLGPEGEPIGPLEALQNAGEFPTLTDQGEGVIPGRNRKPRSRRPKAS